MTAASLGGAALAKKHGGHQSYRHAYHDGAGGAVNGTEDKGQNTVLCAGGGIGGVPDPAQQEFHKADLPDGGQAGDDQVDADEQHEGHRHDAAEQEDQVDQPLYGFRTR